MAQVVRHNFKDIAGGAVKQNLAGPVIGSLGEILKNIDLESEREVVAGVNEIESRGHEGVQLNPTSPKQEIPPYNIPPPTITAETLTDSLLPKKPGTGDAPYQPIPSTTYTGDPHSFLFQNTPEEKPFQLRQFGNVGALTPNGNNLPGGPLQRNSPFKRNGNDPHSPQEESVAPVKGGVGNGITTSIGEATRSEGPGYLGADPRIAQAAQAGYNQVIDRHNYKAKVWGEKQKEVDQLFGKLETESSGLPSYDASVETMAREWKGEIADLYKNKESLDPVEYTQKKQEILARSAQYAAASKNIQGVLSNYEENKNNISTSTPSETIDILETLSKGGDVQVKNVKGIPTLVGTTLGGKNISSPISEIANGKNLWRVNPQVDVQPQLNKTINALAKIKSDRETAQGLTRGTVGWDQLQRSAEGQVDSLLKNDANVRAIAADRFQIDWDAYEELEGGGTNMRAEIRAKLLEEIRQGVAPHQEAETIVQRGNVQAINQQREAQARSARALASKRETEAASAQEAQVVSDYSDSIKEQGFEAKFTDGKYYRRKIGSDEYDTYNTLEELQSSPLKRNSPFRRLVNWMKK